MEHISNSPLVGKTIEEAEALCKDAGIHFRVVSRDGQSYMVTDDYDPERLNLTVVKGIVENTERG